MIHIVSGCMATGTSMMMRALEAGGMPAFYHPARDAIINRQFGDNDYSHNKRYFEMFPFAYQTMAVSPELFDGRLIKFLLYTPPERLSPWHFRFVYMKRPPEEIEQSAVSFLGHIPPHVRDLLGDYEVRTTAVVDGLRARDDVDSVTVLNYHDVINNPLGEFTKLVRAGWPIADMRAATAVPDPARRNHKREVIFA